MIRFLDSKPRLRLLLLLMVSTGFSLLLVAGRMQETRNTMYIFFVWNLFLALIPFVLTTFMITWKVLRKSWLLFLPLFFVWLMFLPNAPYMITDLFHLRPRAGIPLWYDLVLMFSFALNGLVLCFLSLTDMQEMVREKIGTFFSWVMSFGVLFLSAFGIYLGRYLRWNSWDLMERPETIVYALSDRVMNPSDHPRTWGVTMLFAGFLIVGYLIFREIGNQKLRQPKQS